MDNKNRRIIELITAHIGFINQSNQSSILAINNKIKSAEIQDELNKLTDEIKDGDYSKKDKEEIRKVFKEKKDSLLQKTI